jgi:multidrug resistance efflux pump
VRREGHYSSTLGITSPLAGIVTEASATIGQSVDASAPLFTVMDLREVWIAVDVFERDIEKVERGQKVRVGVTAFPDRKLEGTVQSVAATLDPASRTVRCA